MGTDGDGWRMFEKNFYMTHWKGEGDQKEMSSSSSERKTPQTYGVPEVHRQRSGL